MDNFEYFWLRALDDIIDDDQCAAMRADAHLVKQ